MRVVLPTIVSAESIWTIWSKLSMPEIRWTLKNGWIECFSFSAYLLPGKFQIRFNTGPVTCDCSS